MTAPNASHNRQVMILTEKEEAILATVRDLRYVTALDIKHRLFPDRSLTTVQRSLAKLAGGKVANERLLERFTLPALTRGQKQFVYALSTKGREIFGVQGYSRPSKLRALSYGHLAHHLTLTRFVCSALVWCQTNPQVRLADVRLCHDLARELGKAETESQGTPTPAPVVPDGWLHFELLATDTGDYESAVPILLEIDRGSEYRTRFQQHVSDRIDFIRSDKYARFFGAEAVRIAYATTGSRPDYQESRVAAMRTWTKEVLTDLKLEDWASVFYFTAIDYEDIYNLWHFSEPVWQTPTDPTRRYLLAQ